MVSLNFKSNGSKEHTLKEHRCKFKIDKITYSNRSLEQPMTLAETNLQCICKTLIDCEKKTTGLFKSNEKYF